MLSKNEIEESAGLLRGQLKQMFHEYATLNSGNDVDLEDNLLSWLSDLCLLSNVPFHYLIPSTDMLPNNSIRLFYLNPNWQTALLDGACSLGRNATLDLVHDEALIDQVFENVFKRIKAVRPLLQKKIVEAAELDEGVKLMGGFLLRSPLVRGWRGLEFQALSAEGVALKALRIEVLSDDVLIALFDGVPYTLEIAQPPEGFFFGFNHINGKYSKRMRHFEDGSLMAETDTVEVVIKNEKFRTLDIQKTAENMEKFFGKSFTSAEVALQMIKTPYIGRVIRKDILE